MDIVLFTLKLWAFGSVAFTLFLIAARRRSAVEAKDE